jgi:hypothetical protein
MEQSSNFMPAPNATQFVGGSASSSFISNNKMSSSALASGVPRIV